MGWEPTKKREPVTLEVDASRDDDGIAAATITLQPWSTRERLAYEDESLDAMKINVVSGDNGDTAQLKRVIPSKLYLLHLRLTLVGATGFPTMPDTSPAAQPGDVVPFDVQNPDHLRELDEVTFSELLEKAERVQPLPSGKTKKPQDHKPSKPKATALGDGGPEGDMPRDDDGDPSRTPSTQA